MTTQLGLFEGKRAKAERLAEKVEGFVADSFDARAFIDHFEDLVAAAGSLRLLRELILDLAVRGRLTSSLGANASGLLQRLEQMRPTMDIKGVRLANECAGVEEGERPYEIPPGWLWVRIRDLGGFAGGGTPSKSNASFWTGPIPWVSPKDMKRPIIADAEDHISMAAVEASAVKLIPPGSILYVLRGMILAHSFPVALTARQVTVNQDMKALVLALPEMGEFVLCALQAARRRVLKLVERSSHGTCRIDAAGIEKLPIGLPPLDEQKRIVAKVNELMALCDELEARQAKKREISTRLTQSALEALTTAEGPDEFDAGWNRVIDNFSVLIDRAEKVPELREAVLELATRGVLVAPSSKRGAGGEHLRRLVALRESLKPGSTDADTELPAELPVPHPIPPSWCWASLEVLTHPVRLIRYGMLMPGPDRTEGPLYVKVRNMKHGVINVASLQRTSPEIYAKFAGAALARGDLLISIRGSFGGVALVPDEIEGANITQDSARIAPLEGVDRKYLLFALRSPLCQRFFASVAKGAAVQGVNIGDLRRTPIPLPVLEEQRRIVAKVEHLMRVCDDLEAHLRRAEECSAKLVEAAVLELVA